MKENKHIVKDTKKRSLFKALTGNGLEVLIDTIFLTAILTLIGVPDPAPISFTLSVITEFLCFVTNFFNDRIWNLFQWGRKVEHDE